MFIYFMGLHCCFRIFRFFFFFISQPFPFSETDIEWYLQVERLPCRPLSLSFNDSQYFISLRSERDRERGRGRERERYMKQFVTKWMTIKGKKKKTLTEKRPKLTNWHDWGWVVSSKDGKVYSTFQRLKSQDKVCLLSGQNWLCAV